MSASPNVRTGLDRLIETHFEAVAGSRVALVTNQTGVTRDLRDSIPLLAGSDTVTLVALFAPEHGILGAEQAGEHVNDAVERRTGVRVHSLYGANRAPTREQLAGVDAVLFDIQDVGARYYTYLSTLRLTARAATACGARFVVLDRPNPLGGAVEGFPPFDETCRSFISCAPVPIRHGFTYGEFARWLVAVESLDARLDVVPMSGWRREMRFEETGLHWIPPSPNIPTPNTARLYPATCLLEGTNVSEGRGTALPFEVFGAPWYDAYRLADALNALELPGVRFRPTTFTPTFSKHAGQRCEGVQAHLTDSRAFRAVRTGVAIVETLRRLSPEFAFVGFQNRMTLDLLLGTGEVRLALERGASASEICADWHERERRFVADASFARLYDGHANL